MKLMELTETVEMPTSDEVEKYLIDQYEIIDRDMGGVLVIREPEHGLTFDVRARHGRVEVIPHDSFKDDMKNKAEEIRQDIIYHAKSHSAGEEEI